MSIYKKKLTLKKFRNFYEINSYLKTRINQSQQVINLWSKYSDPMVGIKACKMDGSEEATSQSTENSQSGSDRILCADPGSGRQKRAGPSMGKTVSFHWVFKRPLFIFSLTFLFVFFFLTSQRERLSLSLFQAISGWFSAVAAAVGHRAPTSFPAKEDTRRMLVICFSQI